MNDDRKGFSLVEVTLALGLAAICLLVLIALLPVAMQTNSEATSQSVAANLARSIIADLRSARTSSPANVSPRFRLALEGGGSQTLYFDDTGNCSMIPLQGGFRSAISIRTGSDPLAVNIRVTWPAQAPSDRAAVTFDATTFIDL